MSTDPQPPRKNRWFAAEDPDANPWLTMLSYLATVVVSAAVVGAVFAFGPYVYAFTEHNSRASRHDVKFLTDNDTTSGFAWRFWIGAAVGALAMTAYLVRQNRKSDK